MAYQIGDGIPDRGDGISDRGNGIPDMVPTPLHTPHQLWPHMPPAPTLAPVHSLPPLLWPSHAPCTHSGLNMPPPPALAPECPPLWPQVPPHSSPCTPTPTLALCAPCPPLAPACPTPTLAPVHPHPL